MSSIQGFANDRLQAAYEAHIGRIIINRPDRKNAINSAMWTALPAALDWLVAQSARVILLTGAGTRDFSAGADIAEFDTHRSDAETSAAYEKLNSDAFRAVRFCPVPVIAVIRGICFCGGFGLAAAADIRMADSTARFAVPAARLGLAYPVDAMGDILNALGSQYAKLALYSAGELPAGALAAAGTLLPLEEPENLETAARQLAERIASNAPLSIKASKAAINALSFSSRDLEDEARKLGEATFTSRDYTEGRAAFKDRRKPHFTGE